jgi:hypothetical protein
MHEQRMRCLLQVEQEEKAAQDAMFHNFFQWKKEMDASDGTKPLMIPLYPPVRSCHLPTSQPSCHFSFFRLPARSCGFLCL